MPLGPTNEYLVCFWGKTPLVARVFLLGFCIHLILAQMVQVSLSLTTGLLSSRYVYNSVGILFARHEVSMRTTANIKSSYVRSSTPAAGTFRDMKIVARPPRAIFFLNLKNSHPRQWSIIIYRFLLKIHVSNVILNSDKLKRIEVYSPEKKCWMTLTWPYCPDNSIL